MKRIFWIVLFCTFALPATVFASDSGSGDSEADAIIRDYQELQRHIPPALMGLMPQGFEITATNWMLEPRMKMMATFTMQGQRQSADGRAIPFNINFMAYNLDDETGRYTAGVALKLNMETVENEWLSSHPEDMQESPSTHFFAPEKYSLPKGRLYLQKIFTPSYNDGVGMAPEETLYSGFVLIPVEGGYLMAETEQASASRADVENWLKTVATRGSKLNVKALFK